MVKKKSYKEIFCKNKSLTGCPSSHKVYFNNIKPNNKSAHNKLCITRTKRPLKKSHNHQEKGKVRKSLIL